MHTIKNTDIDMLRLYYADELKVNSYITLRQPTIGQIKECGEQRYFSTIQTLTSIPSDMKGWLDDLGIDYEEISDFNYFCLLCPNLDEEVIKLLFGDVLFSGLQRGILNATGQDVLVNGKKQPLMTEDEYLIIADYVRAMHNIYAKREFGTSKYTKMDLIQESKDKMLKRQNEKKENMSMLLPLISTMVNSNGFKHDAVGVLNLHIYEFLDSVKRIGVINSASALQLGCYFGNVDKTKLDTKDLDYMRDISKPEGKKLKKYELG